MRWDARGLPVLAETVFITVGDEILSGSTEDSNFSFAARELVSAGIAPPHKRTSVGDAAKDIIGELKRAGAEADFAVVCGGLGPTPDDLTAQCAGDALGLALKKNAEAMRMVRAALEKRGRKNLPSHNKQAEIPEGATLIPNEKGVAPGFSLRSGRAVYYFLPGVPEEFRAMFSGFVLPDIAKRGGAGGFSLKAVSVFGMPESEIARRVKAMNITGVDIAYRLREFEIQVRVSHRSDTEAVRRAARRITEGLSPAAFPEAGAIAEATARALAGGKLTVATAESCTGGMLAARLTDIAGSSAYFPGGVVSYSNEAKTLQLGVPAETIEEKGAVSEEVALAMARGARERFGADIGVGITGIAGPGGGSFEKPVGTVYIAASSGKGAREECVMHKFTGSRSAIRARSAAHALEMIMRLARRIAGQ